MVKPLVRMGEDFRTIWLHPDDPSIVQIIDQRKLPHELVIHDLTSCADGTHAIREMLVRGAPLIGATAAWSLYLAALGADDGGRLDAVRAAAIEWPRRGRRPSICAGR